MTPQQKFRIKQRAEKEAAGGFTQIFKFLGKTYNLPTRFPKKDIPTLKKFLTSLKDWRNTGGSLESYLNLKGRKKGAQFDNAEGAVWRRLVQYAKGNAPVNPGRTGTGEIYKTIFDEFKIPKKELNIIKDFDFKNIQKFKQGKITSKAAIKNTGDPILAEIINWTNKNPNKTESDFFKAFRKVGSNSEIIKKVKTAYNGAIRNLTKIARGDTIGENQEKLFKVFKPNQLDIFSKTIFKMFPNQISRGFETTLRDVYKDNPAKLQKALKKYQEYRKATAAIVKEFKLSPKGGMKGLGKGIFQLDHPISFAVLEKTGDLSNAIKVNPIAGDVNQFKLMFDKRLGTLRNKIARGVSVTESKNSIEALQRVNKTLFGNLAADFNVEDSGKLKVKNYGANDFTNKNFNPLTELQKNLGLGKNIKDLKLSTNIYNDLTTAGVNVDRFEEVRKMINPLDQKEITNYLAKWAKENPTNSLANDFLKGMSKNPSGRRILSRLGPLAILAVASPFLAGFAPSPVRAATIEKPETVQYNKETGSFVNPVTEDKTDQNALLQWGQENPLTAVAGTSVALSANEVPRSYKMRRGVGDTGPLPSGKGRIRSAIGIGGALKPILTTLGTPAIGLGFESLYGKERLEQGDSFSDILTDPLGPAASLAFMEPLSRGAGVIRDAPGGIGNYFKNYTDLSNVGKAKPGLTSKFLRLGMSPRVIAGASRFLGLPGLALTGGLAAYDAYKNYQNEEGMIYNLFND